MRGPSANSRRSDDVDANEWLERLAATFAENIGAARAREYVEEIDDWQLTPDEWENLRREAKRRFRFFPSLAELHELMLEVARREESPGSPPAWELVTVDGHQFGRRPQRRT